MHSTTIQFTDPSLPGKTAIHIPSTAVDGYINPTRAVLDARATQASTSLVLIGRDVNQYGSRFESNMVRLLENFASDGNPPLAPTIGQLWYNYKNRQMNLWNGQIWERLSLARIDLVHVEEYNAMCDQINKIYSSSSELTYGYGQTKLEYASGQVSTKQWHDMFAVVKLIADHQGTQYVATKTGFSVAVSDDTPRGIFMYRFLYNQLRDMIKLISNNRLRIADTSKVVYRESGSTTVVPMGTSGVLKTFVHEVVFPTNTEYQQFFNAGGSLSFELVVSSANANAPSAKAWNALNWIKGGDPVISGTKVGTTNLTVFDITGETVFCDVGMQGATAKYSAKYDNATGTLTITMVLSDKNAPDGTLVVSNMVVTAPSTQYLTSPEIVRPFVMIGQ